MSICAKYCRPSQCITRLLDLLTVAPENRQRTNSLKCVWFDDATLDKLLVFDGCFRRLSLFGRRW